LIIWRLSAISHQPSAVSRQPSAKEIIQEEDYSAEKSGDFQTLRSQARHSFCRHFSPSFFLRCQTSGRMRFSARQASAKLALLFWPGPTSGTANSQGLLLRGFHDCMIKDVCAISWSNVINVRISSTKILWRTGGNGQF
jgi:hypothetical protein